MSNLRSSTTLNDMFLQLATFMRFVAPAVLSSKQLTDDLVLSPIMLFVLGVIVLLAREQLCPSRVSVISLV